jgi:hypothetical protein
MKTLTLIIILSIISIAGFGQTNIRVNTETVGFWTLTNDSLRIKAIDKVIHGSVTVPSTSSASVVISGCKFTVDGHRTNGVTIPAGSGGFDFGFDYAFSDSIKIKTTGTAWIMLLIKRSY